MGSGRATLRRRHAGGGQGHLGVAPGSAGASAGIRLTITDAAADPLAKDCYDPVYGARPLKRLIQSTIENPPAKRIVAAEYTPGDHIEVDASRERFTFEKKAAAPAEPTT